MEKFFLGFNRKERKDGAKRFIKHISHTRWVKLNDLNFDIINWSVKDKFIDILH